MRLFDTHCHLDFPQFDKDRDKVIKRAIDSGVVFMVNVGIDIETSKKSIEIARKYPFIFASAGIHPNEVKNFEISDLKKIEELGKDKKIVGIGETGLDYHYGKELSDRQKEFFIGQIEIAGKLGLPLIIHQRQAVEDMIEIIEKKKFPERVVFHCFDGDENLLKICEEKGFFISITGIVTFPNAHRIREAVKKFPFSRILAETDSPFLSPVPLRGKRNEPCNVRYIVEKISELKGRKLEESAEEIFINSVKFFNLPDYLQNKGFEVKFNI